MIIGVAMKDDPNITYKEYGEVKKDPTAPNTTMVRSSRIK